VRPPANSVSAAVTVPIGAAMAHARYAAMIVIELRMPLDSFRAGGGTPRDDVGRDHGKRIARLRVQLSHCVISLYTNYDEARPSAC